jgi:hypothetical protein
VVVSPGAVVVQSSVVYFGGVKEKENNMERAPLSAKICTREEPSAHLTYPFEPHIAFDDLFRAFVKKRIDEEADRYCVGRHKNAAGATVKSFEKPYSVGGLGFVLRAVGATVATTETVVLDRRARAITVTCVTSAGTGIETRIDIAYREGPVAGHTEAVAEVWVTGVPELLRPSVLAYFEKRFRQEHDTMTRFVEPAQGDAKSSTTTTP